MKCQVVNCDKQAIIDDSDGDDALCLCADHQGIELVHYVEMPDTMQECQCAACVNRRKKAVDAYKVAIQGYRDVCA